MSRKPVGQSAMTAAERQRRRRARLAAERPPQHDPRDEELSRLRAEVARLQAVQRADAGREHEVVVDRVRAFGLSATAQQKIEAAVKAHKRKLEIEFEELVREACKKRMEELNIPFYLQQIDEIKEMFTWPRNSVMTRAEYNTILRCLHPDGLNSRTEAQLAEAFRLFTRYEPKMVAVDDEERARLLRHLPRTREELLARKKKRGTKTDRGNGVTTSSS